MAFSNQALRAMIKEHGVNAVLNRQTSGTYNATTGKVVQSQVSYRVKAYPFNYSPEILSQRSTADTDSRAVLDPVMLNGLELPAPKVNDELVVLDKTLKIIKVDSIRSAGKVMCWLLDTRA